MKTKHLKSVIIFAALLLIIFIQLQLQPSGTGQPAEIDEVIIAMCRPSVSQIKNIEFMFEKDIIPLKQIILLGVYHEKELTNYTAAQRYVVENKLSWVIFQAVKGDVKQEDLFKKNQWTAQFKEIFKRSHGIIFTGGADIPPALYGDDQNLLTEVRTPTRHYYELSFLFHLLGGSQNPGFVPLLESRKDYVVLGICLGYQTMNVACGGTLVQDIPSQVYGFSTLQQVLNSPQDAIHSSRYLVALHPLEQDLAPAFHQIKILEDNIFTKQMKMKVTDTPFILTSHHQAIKETGKGLKVIATSMDGKIIEAVEHEKYENVLGIQFHPEPYILYLKGIKFKKAPGKPLDFNLRSFLEENPPSMEFHKNLWQWFSSAMKK